MNMKPFLTLLLTLLPASFAAVASAADSPVESTKPNILLTRFNAALGDEHGEMLFDALPGVQFLVKNRVMLAAPGFTAAEQLPGRTVHGSIAR